MSTTFTVEYLAEPDGSVEINLHTTDVGSDHYAEARTRDGLTWDVYGIITDPFRDALVKLRRAIDHDVIHPTANPLSTATFPEFVREGARWSNWTITSPLDEPQEVTA